MKGNRAVIAAVVVVVLVLVGVWLFRGGGTTSQIDLIEQLPAAKKQPVDRAFEVTDVTLNGDTRRAIDAPPPTRLTWRVTVPDDAWLRVHLGMKPESWTAEGDGVLFFVVVSDGRTSEPLFEQHVNPFSQSGDRKWIPVMVDLSQYAGEQVDVIFNTRTSPAGKGDDSRNDLAVWGDPEIITR